MQTSSLLALVILGLVARFADPQAPRRLDRQLAGDLATVLEDGLGQELVFTPVPGQEGLFGAPDRGLRMRSQVSHAGLELFMRAPEAGAEDEVRQLLLGTKSFGRMGEVRPLSGARLSVEGRRAELDHGSLVEWFVNSVTGIEHGWTIAEREPGSGCLWIGLEVQGELAFRIDEGARSATLVDGSGETRLRYLDLLAFDATGRALDASLQPSQEGLGIRIDDADAVYPLVVDPLLTGPQWMAESNQSGSNFGFSVAPAGDVDGDGYCDALVGAPFFNNTGPDQGRVFLYLGSASGLTSPAAWTAEITQNQAEFGHSVALAGDVNGDGYGDVIIGAPGYDNGETDEGGAFLYLGSASGLAASPSWSVESNQAAGGPNHPTLFGDTVATAGDVNGDGFSDVLVGATEYDNGEIDEGCVFLYLGSAGGLATTPAWTGEINQAGASFGSAVATAGDVNGDGYEDVLIGAEQFDNGQTDEGGAFLYLGSASGLGLSPAWNTEGDQVQAQFGATLSTAGDLNGDRLADVVVGAPCHDGGQVDEGRVAFFLGSSGVPVLTALTSVESDQAGAQLGVSVATAGDLDGDGYGDVLAGGELFDSGLVDAGLARIFYGGPTGIVATLDLQGTQAGAHFGHSVSTVGDVNSDGFSDLVVGESSYTNGESSEGRVLAYLGRRAGFGTAPNWVVGVNSGGSAAHGDVNGDGYSDLVAGDADASVGLWVNAGVVRLYLGGSNGPSQFASLTLSGAQPSARFGSSLAAGDVNGDGYSDVIVGAPGYSNGQAGEGQVALYLGSAEGLAALPAWTAESDNTAARLGAAVCVGDVNGDGLGDLVVGAPSFENGQMNEGRVSAYFGTRTGLSSTPLWSFESNQVNARVGTEVAAADVNSDGFSDVFEFGLSGYVLEFQGSQSGLSATPTWGAPGSFVASAGDVNGDGFSDILVSGSLYAGSHSGLSTEPLWSTPWLNLSGSAGDVNGDGYGDVMLYKVDLYLALSELSIYLAYGAASGPSGLSEVFVNAWTTDARLSFAIAAGDVNGDSLADLFVGAGDRIQLYLGNEGRGSRLNHLQQRRHDDSAPISVLGKTDRTGLFRLEAEFPLNSTTFAWSRPQGTTAHFEWELRPLGVSFNELDLQRGPGFSLESGGTALLDELVSAIHLHPKLGLASDHPVHWRVRVATDHPFFPHTPWFGLQGSALSEGKLRGPKHQP